MSYDPSLPTDKDLVRFLLGDTGATERYSDDEINAIGRTEPVSGGGRAYFIAASILQAEYARYATANGAAGSKTVGPLSINKGGGAQLNAAAYDQRIKWLRENGARISSGTGAGGFEVSDNDRQPVSFRRGVWPVLLLLVLLFAPALHAQPKTIEVRGSSNSVACRSNKFILWASSVTGQWQVCENGATSLLGGGFVAETAPGTSAGTRCIVANTVDGTPSRICVAGTTDTTLIGGYVQAVLGNDTGAFPNWSYLWAGSAADGWAAGLVAHYSNITVDDINGGIYWGTSNDGVNYAILNYRPDGLLATSSDGNKPLSIRLDAQATPPFTCDAGHKGIYYYDDSDATCKCNGAAWTKVTAADPGACT